MVPGNDYWRGFSRARNDDVEKVKNTYNPFIGPTRQVGVNHSHGSMAKKANKQGY